jgi:ribA/ribD-fused uncharacterized protein
MAQVCEMVRNATGRWPTSQTITQQSPTMEIDLGRGTAKLKTETYTVIPSFDDRAGCEFLSNFYAAPIVIDGETWPTSEHYFQGMKMHYPQHRERIRLVNNPGEAKYLGQVNPMRSTWDQERVDVMLKAVRAKFTQHSDLRQKLLDTGDALLVEGNTWSDRLWGAVKGEGENILGLVLMLVRAELRSVEYKKPRHGG